MPTPSLSYREVIPDNTIQENWTEIVLNTGGTQSTLQDIKVADKAGGYCYKNAQQNHNRNRFIYWRTRQDTLELSEISLDFNLYQNNLRYKFSDSPVLAVHIVEQDVFVTVLVITVCSLHCINFPHPDTLAESNGSSSGSACSSASIDVSDSSQSFSIFRETNAAIAKNPISFYVLDPPSGGTSNPIPFAAHSSSLSVSGEVAYFALASQAHLNLYVMNCRTGQTTSHQLKEQNIMPRLFTNIKDAFIGKSDLADATHATSLLFTTINEEVYLLSLHRNDLLRIWSVSSFHSVCSISCAWEGNEQCVQGPQNNMLRAISETSVCAFLSHSTGAEFVCLDINASSHASGSGALSLVRRKIVNAPQLDLTDFNASPKQIWALWNNAEGEFSISSFCLSSGTGMHWVSAAMEPPPDRYSIGIEYGMNTREAYCSYIFHPGKFDRNVISKALFMFRRSNVNFDAKHCGIAMLKEHVCQAIEDEIQNEVKEFDVSDEEYIEISTRLWERFYSCCEQYHMKASQPIGIVNLDAIDAICVVKKNSFSLLRPCETLEHLMLAGDHLHSELLIPLHFSGNEHVGEDLVNLMGMLSQMEKWLPEDVKIDLDRRMFQLETPSDLIAKLTDSILAGGADREILPVNFLVVIQQRLQVIGDLRLPITLLLDFLRMDNGNPEAMVTYSNVAHASRFLSNIGALFGSHVGLSVLVESVRQTIMIRFAICRNLLLLQQILIDTYTLPVDVLEVLRTQFVPDTMALLRAYYSMVWIAETPVNLTSVTTLEPANQRLQQLKLISGSGRIYSNGGKTNVALLLSLFLNAKGLYTALSLYANTNMEEYLERVTWPNTLMPLTTIICQLIWPISLNFVFGEWIFSTCQHNVIEGYVRLLNGWCEWNSCSRQFILAISHLNCGNSYKSYDLFLHSAKGVLKEPFLTDKMLKDTDMEHLHGHCDDVALSNQAIATYYLKVIQIFEQHNELSYIILMAQAAIGLVAKDDPQLPMFQSIVFNNHLQLEHYEEAYHSLIYNADSSRRKDCLRQLVVTLFNRKRLDLMMRFPYVGLHEEFENIVESRARSLVMEQNEIYDFLYAFHVNNGNMRKASAVMYEQAMRFQMETETFVHMQKRCSSLLVCINALHLIDERYRWIAKPVFADECAGHRGGGETSTGSTPPPANSAASEGKLVEQKVVVLEIDDIRRELLHSEALVLLAQHRKNIQTFIKAGPMELSMILASCGLFTAALKLAKGYKNTLLPIFESLVSACVRTANEPVNDAWSWLQDNDLAVLPHRNSAADMAWSLLQKLVEENEETHSTKIRKSVVKKLLSLNVFVPQWLHNSYKLVNCSELLHLYVVHSRLLEATELSKEMLCAMLGAGCEYFSCGHALAVTNAEMCLPLNSLDLLLHSLKLNAEEDIEYRQAYLELDDMLQKYVSTALRTADDKIRMSHQANMELQVRR